MTLHAQQHYKLLRHAIGFWHTFANKTGMCCTHQIESRLVWTALVQNSTPPYFKQANNPGFYKHAITSQGDAMPEDNRVSRAPLETCIYAPPGPISSVLSPRLCHYLRPMPICCMIVCFLFNGEHQQSDVIRAALMTGWLPNPARFHALLMLTCWIQDWNGEIREQRERERLKDLAFEAIKLPCGCRNNRHVKMQQSTF